MICYHCGGTLGSGNRCLHCGTDVTVYRKIVRTSNAYYNKGLEKAKIRNLTGAIECLETSLQYNKNNTEARNLLGLIYFEMGEVCEALGQWIVSKNLQPEHNLCDTYLDMIKQDKNLMDDMDQAVKKYNQALEQAKIEGSDLAVITLKRVIKQQPHMVKAYQLLALIYIQNEEYSRANRLLKKALEIDKGNIFCQAYSKKIQGKLGRTSHVVPAVPEKTETAVKKAATEAVHVSGSVGIDDDETILPRRRPEFSVGVNAAAAVVIGVVIGMFLYQFVILRTVNRDYNTELNRQIASYDTKLADKNMEVKTLQDQVDALQTDNDSMKEDMQDYTSDDGVITQYERLMALADDYLSAETPDKDELLVLFRKISKDATTNSGYQSVYRDMYRILITDYTEEIYQQGLQLISEDYYTQAIDYFKKCLTIQENFDKAIYQLGVCYDHRDESDIARDYYVQIVTQYPDSEFYNAAVAVVGEDPLNQNTPEEGAEGEEADPDEGDEE